MWNIYCILLISCTFCMGITREEFASQIFRSLLINEEHKFLFCPIEKIGSTLWRQLFLRLSGDPHWYEPPWHKRTSERKYKRSEIWAFFKNPNWTKAIFFRDPSVRLLSAYMHLIQTPTRGYPGLLKQHNLTATWSDFWQSATTPSGLKNLHWQAQTDFCFFRGFKRYYNFIGSMEQLEEHGKALLQRVGVYDSYGAYGWSLASVIKRPYNPVIRPGKYAYVKTPEIFNQGDCMFCKNHAVHRTNATKADSSKYLDEATWRAIVNSSYYSLDYRIFRTLNVGPMLPNQYDNYPFAKKVKGK